MALEGELRLVALPELSDLVVCALLQTIAARVKDHLRRQGVLSDDDDAALACAAQPHADAEQLVLSALAAASSLGQALAGPETRPGRMPHLHQADAQPRIERPLCAAFTGFSLHASTAVAAADTPGRERLIKYILRPPLAAERLERLDDQGGGRVRLRLKRPFSDGTWAIEMDELSLVARLAALVPPPWQNQVRYSGVLAPASKWRPRIVPKPTAEPTPAEQPEPSEHPPCDHDGGPCQPDRGTQRPVPKGKGCRYWPWRLLKARTFGEPTARCSQCAGELTLRALVQDPDSIRRILTHLGLPTDIPKPAPARGPPYYRAPARRMRPRDAQQVQEDLPS